MDKLHAISALAALGQETRLDVFRHLVKASPDGVAAGDLAVALGVRPNTLSSHLAQLVRAGLIVSDRDGRSIRYRADHEGLGHLITYLIGDCCGGCPELCGGYSAAITHPPVVTRGA